MKQVIFYVFIGVVTISAGGCGDMSSDVNIEAEKARIKEVIENNIGWAAKKDTALLYSTIAHDEDLFYFSPRDAGTVEGFKAFVNLTENFFMLDDFKAIGFTVKGLQIKLSQSGTVAWYHARLDDYNEWKGQPANWEDVRWTGVLEKRDGAWVIVQMHFSSATDKE